MQCDFIFQNYWYLWYNQENNGMAEIVKKVKLLVTISRNAPCPCGSGRKYKHCCGKTKTVSLQSIVERELEECVFDVLAYAADRYEDEIVPFLEEWQTEGLPEELAIGIELFVTNWAIFCLPLEGENTTIFASYLQDRRSARWRPAVRTQIESWQGAVPSFDELIGRDGERNLFVRDVLTGEEKQVHIFEADEVPEMEEGDILIGLLVPYGQAYTYFTTLLAFPRASAGRLIAALRQEQEQHGKTDGRAFLRHAFPEAMGLAVRLLIWEFVRQMEWEKPEYEAVMQELERRLPNDQEEALVRAHAVWRMYCNKEHPRIGHPAVYAAALHYFVCAIAGEEELEEEEVAFLYEVPLDKMSAKVDDLMLFSFDNMIDDDDEEWDDEDLDFLDDDDWGLDDEEDVFADDYWGLSDEDGWLFDDDGEGDEIDLLFDELMAKMEELLEREGWDEKKVMKLIKDLMAERVAAGEIDEADAELVCEAMQALALEVMRAQHKG
jgi:SEC-C motif